MQDDRVRSSLANALVRLFRQVNRLHNRALQRHGLSAEQAHVLVLLWIEGPKKIGELQRMLMLSSGTLTGAIDRMEQAGLVRRVPDPGDGRAYRVEPARFDARRQKAIEATIDETDDQCFAALTAAERRELLRLLTKATEGLAG